MDQQRALDLLRSHEYGIAEWNRLRQADEVIPDLIGVNLSSANLRLADLRDVNLSMASLCGADLQYANLSGARLRGTDLELADLRWSRLKKCDFSKADLRQADLSQAWAHSADFIDANLTSAKLAWAELDRARFIRADLTDAQFNHASVLDIVVKDLRGLPQPPTNLRLWGDDLSALGGDLIGDDAKNFFLAPCILEVFVSERLAERELASFLLHLAEMHDSHVGDTVYFVGHRYELGGTFLRFQSVAFNAIYDVLPDLLAPFRLSQAIDWKLAIEKVSDEERRDIATSLVSLEARQADGRWRIAERMAKVFSGYRNARVVQIAEGRSRGIRIDLFTNKEIARRLTDTQEDELWDGRQPLTITTGSNSSIHVGDIRMSQHRTNVSGGLVGVIGDNAHAHDMTFQQIWNQSASQIDLAGLANELAALRQALKSAAQTVEHDAAVGEVAAAETAAKKGDGPSVLERLKNAGQWVLDVAVHKGLTMAVTALKSALGV